MDTLEVEKEVIMPKMVTENSSTTHLYAGNSICYSVTVCDIEKSCYKRDLTEISRESCRRVEDLAQHGAVSVENEQHGRRSALS